MQYLDLAGQRTIVGAPAFLSPEQFEGKDATRASDLYSLAALTYVLLTGSLAYEGQEYPRVRKANFLRGPSAAHHLAQKNGLPTFPAAVSDVLNRALNVRPEERFETARDFVLAFRDALKHIKAAAVKPISVFLSYHRAESTAWARYFKSGLESQHQYEVFVDTAQRDTAGSFPQRLQKNVGRCDVFVCILSGRALESEWVKREVELAHKSHKPMIPVFLESFPIPGKLDEYEPHLKGLLECGGVKMLDQQNIYVEAALDLLADLIRQSLD